uniref:Cuticle protein n=1 Tax=Bombyx mori TaxID=7091 RepID=A0A8R2DJZ2_BOMMO|nr:cyclin-dependent kinase inhibitor 1C-like isoform X2 [Bombyx mori]
MAARLCVYVFVIYATLQNVTGKPFFGVGFWCDLFCDEDYSSTSSSDDYDYCDDCTPRRRTTTTVSPAPALMLPNLMLSQNGLNMTISQVSGAYQVSMIPFVSQSGATMGTAAGAAQPVPAATNPEPAVAAPPAPAPAAAAPAAAAPAAAAPAAAAPAAAAPAAAAPAAATPAPAAAGAPAAAATPAPAAAAPAAATPAPGK